jgi:multicomponent Na+:H+ antiporter subunit E
MSRTTRGTGQVKPGFWQRIPLLIWLVLVWGALWQNFSLGNLVFGALIAIGVSQAFYLPPVELSGRFNVLRAFAFVLVFLKDVTIASFNVFYLAVVRGPNIRNAVIAVPLRSRSDLMMTATGHVLSLIPGSLVVDVDRATSTLYVHALNVTTPQGVEKVRAEIRHIEAGLIKIMGTREELAALRAEESGTATNVKGGAGA